MGVSLLTNFRLDNRPCESRYHITWESLGYLTTANIAATLFTTDAITASAPTLKGKGQVQKNQ